MNSKKGKTKNRPKPSKTAQNVDETKEAESINNADETVKCESLNKEEISLTERPIEAAPEIEEQPVTAAIDAPKKPKRSKTKKKQDTWIEPIVQDNSNTNTAEDDKKENTELQESLDVVPVARKKKNKSKKVVDQPKVDVEPQTSECEIKEVEEKNIKTNLEILQKEHIHDVTTQDVEPPKTCEVLQKESIVSKKKKKKKHRNDSEKSDANDPCTLAFQKLLESSEDVNEEIETDKVSLDTLNKTENTVPIPVLFADSSQSGDLQGNLKDEATKSKKKNKKGKKHPLETETHVNKEYKPELEENITMVTKCESITTENVQLDTTTVDLNLKPKAKIVKPVQKKRKAKSESQDENIPESLEIDSDCKINESTKHILNEPKIDSVFEEKQINKSSQESEITADKSITLNDDTKDIENKVLSEQSDKIDISVANLDSKSSFSSLDLSKNEEENVVTEKTMDLPKFFENLQEKDITKPDIDKGSDNLGFVKVKSGKQKKKRQQNIDNVPEIIESVGPSTGKDSEKNISEHETKTNIDQKETYFDATHCDFVENKQDELETLSIATPDLIQYPRSTSQQHIDDNNNETVIEEITTTDEVKLGIPIYTATPIIQGSGESPDAKTLTEPITVKVTEMASPLSTSNEKNDIKSRIIEVNNDMEELRRSIERSLAELTGAEICPSEVDKEFEELFQKQIKDSQVKKPSEDKLESLQAEQSILPKPSDDEIMKLQKESADIVKTKTIRVNKMETPDERKCDQTDPTDQPIPTDDNTQKPDVETDAKSTVPICPARSKGKSKSKKKGKKEALSTSTNNSSTQSDATNKDTTKTSKSNNSEKSDQKPEPSKEKGKQQSINPIEGPEADSKHLKLDLSFEPIENFEDALTSSADDVNKTFEIIVNEATESLRQNNPQINIIAPKEDIEENNKEKKRRQNSVSQPKNLLGKPNIPASSNKTDYKKEKNKPPNSIQAKVKIKDSVEIEKINKELKESRTDNKNKFIKQTHSSDTYSYLSNTNEDFIYKYSFRKVFLQSSCHVCKKTLTQRFPCKFCSLVFYCSQKHQDEDWAKHQFLCFAVSTIAHLKEQKHIYADVQNITGQDYRVLRMQMILSCEKILKRKLVPWEQEALLYPRLCADTNCRQWKQTKLKDCEGCGQISYCIEHQDHLPLSHQRWCKSYALYQKLVNYQQTKGRLEPKLPTKVMEHYTIPEKINEVLGAMYEEKIDMDEIQYAALTQLASAPLTAAYGYQLHTTKMNSTCANGVSKKVTFTIHAVGPDLQFEADALNKWEVFFLHLRPDVQELRVVLVGPDLNPSELPLDLLGKIKLCENCRVNKRRVIFHFHDKETYHEYYSSDDFITPDIICAFNPNIQRSSMYNVNDTWPSTINSIVKQKVPFIITSFNIEELERDMSRVKEISRYNFNVVSEPKHNPFSSLRPDRNFITDHEIPLLFKNYCFSILCGVF